MADITIIRNGARISLASFPKLGSGSENIAVAVSASGAYDTYTTELYYGWYQGSSMQKMLAQYQNGLYYIPSNALFNAGNVYLTLRLVSGSNKVSTNTIPITIEKSAVNNEYSILPATETWQNAVDYYINNSNSSLNKRLDNLVANTGNSNSEIVDARVGYNNNTYSTLGEAIRKQFEKSVKGKGSWLVDNNPVITDANDAEENTIYFFSFDKGKVANIPENGTLICLSTHKDGVGQAQILISWSGKIYTRIKWTKSAGWSNWNMPFYGNTDLCLKGFGQWLKDGSKPVIADANDADANTIYFFSFGAGNAANVPEDGLLLCVSCGSADNSGKAQILIGGKGQVYIRMKWTNDTDWTDWVEYNKALSLNAYGSWISSDGKGSVLNDLNDAQVNTIYFISADNVLNKPENGTLVTFSAVPNEKIGNIQLMVGYNGELYTRMKFTSGANWTAWKSYGNNLTFKVEKDGSGDFTKLSDAITEATKYMDSKIYVGAGTWDLIEELGDEWWSKISASNRGLYLKNRVHIICSSDSEIVVNYKGGNTTVEQWATIFNAGDYGFTLENATLKAYNCRYTIHDEMDYHTIPYTNKYINCKFLLDNTNSVYEKTTQCLGGGLGANGNIVIDGCTFNGVVKGDNSVVYAFYHNTWSKEGKSNIIVKNSYFKNKGTFRLSWFGTATKITECIVTNCSLGSALIHERETADGTSPNKNTSLLEWNNVVR